MRTHRGSRNINVDFFPKSSSTPASCKAPEYPGVQNALACEIAVATTASQLRTCSDLIDGDLIKAVPIK
jgi:hypothetical protein